MPGVFEIFYLEAGQAEMTISEIFSKTDRSGICSLASKLCMSSAILIALGSTAHAATADLDAVMARLEKLEADNKRIVSENADLKQRLHRLEGSKQANSINPLVLHQEKYITSTSAKTKLLEKNLDAFPVIPKANSNTAGVNSNSKWSGFYGGLNAGYGWGLGGSATTSSTPVADNYNQVIYPFPQGIVTTLSIPSVFGISSFANNAQFSPNANGIFGGIQIGYNAKVYQNFVFGMESDIQGSSLSSYSKYQGIPVTQSAKWSQQDGGNINNHAVSTNFLGFGSVSTNINWLGSTRLRLGWLPSSNLLIYATGGLAYGGTTTNFVNQMNGFGVYNYNRNGASNSDNPYNLVATTSNGQRNSVDLGWIAGGGGEWMFTENWSLKAEALYYSLGSHSVTASPLITPVTAVTNGYFLNSIASIPTAHVSYEGLIGRAGVNYHFNLNNLPVAAKL